MNTTTCKSSDFAPELGEARDTRRPGLATMARRLLAVLETWQRRSNGRKRLLAMSDHILADIGIDRVDARREAAKPFWKS